MTSVKNKHNSSSATYLRHCQSYGESGERGEGCTFIGGGGCISISMCISGADGGGEGSASSYLVGDDASHASCASMRLLTSSASIGS